MSSIFKGQSERKTIKTTHSREDFRRKRGDRISMLRKAKKEQMLNKRRRQGTTQDGDYMKSLAQIPELVKMIASPSDEDRLNATRAFRELLSRQDSPPLRQVVEAGVIPCFVQFLDRMDAPNLQFEAAWALTNIASDTSNYTALVINHGAVPKLVSLLSSKSDNVKEQAAWALGNIAGDSINCRNYILNRGAMPPLLKILSENPKTLVLRNVMWAVSNLCRAKPSPEFSLIAPAIPVVATNLYHPDYRVLVDSCWAMSYLSDGPNKKIEAVIKTGIVRRLVELMQHHHYDVQVPALRTIGNIVTGNDAQTDEMLGAGCLEALRPLLQSHRSTIRKEACWTVSNITAGPSNQIKKVIEAKIIPQLRTILEGQHWETKKEAAWAISNATNGGSDKQIQYLVQQGCVGPLCDLLDCKDPKIVTVALEALDNILAAGKRIAEEENVKNHYLDLVDERGGLEKIEQLQLHKSNDIYEKALHILEKFWPEDGEGPEDGFDFSQNNEVQAPTSGYTF